MQSMDSMDLGSLDISLPPSHAPSHHRLSSLGQIAPVIGGPPSPLASWLPPGLSNGNGSSNGPGSAPPAGHGPFAWSGLAEAPAAASPPPSSSSAAAAQRAHHPPGRGGSGGAGSAGGSGSRLSAWLRSDRSPDRAGPDEEVLLRPGSQEAWRSGSGQVEGAGGTGLAEGGGLWGASLLLGLPGSGEVVGGGGWGGVGQRAEQ